MMDVVLRDLIPVVFHRSLNVEEIRAAATDLLDTSVTDEIKSDFLVAWATRGERAPELAACAEEKTIPWQQPRSTRLSSWKTKA